MNANFDNLLQSFRQIAKQVTPKTNNSIKSIEWLDKLNEQVIVKVLGTYSAVAVERMATNRKVVTQNRKKQWIVSETARRFYDTENLEQALKNLSPVARDGYNRIKQAGGVINLANWQSQMQARHGRPAVGQAQTELVGSLLALYGQFYSTEHIEFQTTSRRHELTQDGWGWGNIVLWSFPKALSLFQPNEAENANITKASAPQPYSAKNETPKVAQEASFDTLLADLFAFMRYLEQNKVKVLQSGDIGKRDYVKLNELMSIKEAKDSLTEARKLSDLGRVNFIWRLLTETKLVTAEMYQEVKLNPTNNDEFYALPRYKQARLMTAAWMRSSFNDFVRVPTINFYDTNSTEYNDIPDTDQQAQARTFLLTTLEGFQRQNLLPGQQWLDFKSLLSIVHDRDPEFLIPPRASQNYYYYNYRYETNYYGTDQYSGFDSKLKKTEKGKPGYMGRNAILKRAEDWELVDGEWIAQLFQESLAWLGLVELGQNSQGRPVAFRLTELGQAVLADQPTEAELSAAEQTRQLAEVAPDMAKALLVQPNFDLMILAPLQHQTLLRQVDRFANQASLGDVAMYRITKDSVLRGLRSGLTGAEVLQVLNDNSRVPVAPNIITTIKDWAAEFERLVLYEFANVLETPSTELLDRLMAHPDAPKYILERLGPTFALIKGDPSHLDGLLQQLQREIGVTLNSRQKEALPIYLDYSQIQPGAITVEGERTIKVVAHMGNPYLYYLLGQFADLVSWEAAKMSGVFQLSAQAGQRAQRLGLTYEIVLNTIRTWMKPEKVRGYVQQAKLPAEMDLALKGWLGYYSPMLAEKALAVQVTQSEQLDNILSLPEFGAAIIGQAGPRTFLVRESHFAAFRTRLTELGMPIFAPEFDPPPQVAPEPVVAEVVAEPETPKTGKRGKAKEKAPPKPKETTAERERKRREAQESAPGSNNPFGGSGLRGGASFGPPQDFLQFLEALTRANPALLFDIDDFDEDDLPPGPPRGRR
jgi:hypothetical protein